MTPEQIAARLALRDALSRFHSSRHELGQAMRALRKVVEVGTKTPAFLRPQAD
jgi:hypothetical protein